MDKNLLSTSFPTALLFIFTAIFFSCTDSTGKKITRHYSEEMLAGFEKICEQQKSRDTGIYLIDSLYSTFPYISVPDKYRYYDFKQKMFELVRFGDRSYDTAISYLDTMITLIEDNGLQNEMSNEYKKAFNTRGEYYTRRQRYNDAIRDISRSRQLNEQVKDSCLVAENTKTLSSIAVRQENFPMAVNLIKEAIYFAETCNKDEDYFIRMQRYLDDLGHTYNQINADSCLKYHLAAAKFVNEHKYLMSGDTLFPYIALDNIYGNITFVCIQLKKYQEADFYAKELLKINENIIRDSLKHALAQYLMGSAHLANGRLEEAESMTQKASLQIHNFDSAFMADLLLVKADIARQKKQYKAEADYRKEIVEIAHPYYRRIIKVLQNNPLIEYEQLDKKYQVELLKKENQIQRNKVTAAVAIGILVTLLAVISLFLLWRLRIVMKKRTVVFNRLVRSEMELKETMLQKEIAEKQLREKELFSQEMRLQMEFNEAIIQQRRQISDDMHDELSSSLAALKFYVEDMKQRASGTGSEQTLSDIAEEVSTIYQNARSYMHSLKTNNWETCFSLIGFLKEIQQKFSEKGLMDIRLNLAEEGIKSRLGTHQHDQLYHIIREAISNVIKHASATELSVTVSFNNDECIFIIADNGKGFKKELVVNGIGIQSMKNRIKDIGGELNINSLQTGTVIEGRFTL